jgi:multidrug transporter EmrE-like cation transporter
MLTVYSQLIVKWVVMNAGEPPSTKMAKAAFLLRLLFNPWLISVFVAVLLASLFWMAAITKMHLSHAYPFMSLAFVLVSILSAVFFHEAFTIPKLLGMTLIISGIIIGSQG